MAVWHDPPISPPPKLCCQNSAENCRLIRCIYDICYLLFAADCRNGEMWISPNNVALSSVAKEIGQFSVRCSFVVS